MEKSSVNKIVLDKLCEYAEIRALAKTDQEKFDIDQTVYDFLVYSGFSNDMMTGFTDNYRRLEQEFIP